MKTVLLIAAAVLLVSAGTATAKPEALIGIGPGLIPAARDAAGATEGVDTYVDLGFRYNSWISGGIRDRQLPENRALHSLGLWSRFDLTDYHASDVVLYGRLSYEGVVVPMGSFHPDFTQSQWTFAGGMEVKQSQVFSLTFEGEGTFGLSSDQINALGIRAGALFRLAAAEK